jgi:hypothetical protein
MDDLQFFGNYFFERLYPKHIRRNCWLTWVTRHSSQNNFLTDSIFENICVVNAGWLGWLVESRQLIREWFEFRKYVCCNCWLTWVTFQFSQNYFSRCSIFENMCVVNSGWLGWLVESRKTIRQDIRFLKLSMSLTVVDLGDLLELDSRNSNFSNCIRRKRCLNGWLSILWYIFFRETLSKTCMSQLLVDLGDSPFLAKLFL